MRLSDKKCLVTAAGQGIGKETAIRFAEEGANVVAVDINESALDRLSKERSDIKVELLDATSAEAITQFFADNSAFDVVFNCVGYVASGNILECDETDWRRSFSINVDSMYHICRNALPPMLAQRSGCILNVSSVASSIKGVPNRFAYSTTKAAVIGLTKAIAADFISQGIRCNAICPGTVSSPSLEQRLAATGNYEKAKAEFIARQPMGRIGEPAEIAALAAYLASPEAAFTTGTINIIDGGWSI